MTTIQIRIDDKTKKSAQRIFNKLGIDMSTAIKAYLKQVTIREGIPFDFITENGLTIAEEQEILRDSADAKKGIGLSGPYTSAEDLIKDLKKSIKSK